VKKAFTLIELMIVIVIIGVIYALAVVQLKDAGKKKDKPSLANLKEYLYSLNKDSKSTQLLCLDDCSRCSIYQDGKKIKTIKSFFDSSIKVYNYDFLQGAIEKRMPVFFNKEGVQESVCFSFGIDKSKVSDQVIVVYKEKAYDYTNYFEKTKIFDSLDDAIEAKQRLAQEVIE